MRAGNVTRRIAVSAWLIGGFGWYHCCAWANPFCQQSAPDVNIYMNQEAIREMMANPEAIMANLKEEELGHWKPNKENSQVPMASIRSRQRNIVGTWTVDGSALLIKHNGTKDYLVDFSTAGCLGHWCLQRKGHLANGIFILSRPVEEYASFTYQKLYVVRVGDKDYLVPDAAISDFQKSLSKDGKKIIDDLGIRFYAYSRRPAEKKLK